jgi:hypothetical protein
MLPIDELSPCFYRTKYMGGIIDTPLYTPKVIRLYEKQQKKKP